MTTKNSVRSNTGSLIAALAMALLVCTTVSGQSDTVAEPMDRIDIMTQLQMDPGGKTEVVKNFPANFPAALTARGKPIVYTRENSENFEYIGMPIGSIGAGQLYLGGDGQLWFWDIYGLSYKKGHLRGEEAYEFPYKRSEPGVDGNASRGKFVPP